ncbi:hypothetical protein MTO96_047717 [Rhipicephalus appendiculatus]
MFAPCHQGPVRGATMLAESPFSPRQIRAGTSFGDLLSACHQRMPITFSQLFDHMEADHFTNIGRGRLSEVFRVHSYKGDSALDLLRIDSVIGSWNRLFTKTVIATKLSDLRTSKQHYTDAFLEIKRVACVFDSYPRELRQVGNKRCSDEGIPYLAVHMSYGGVPLHRFQFDSPLQIRSVLQQVVLALAVAEEALQFEHRNLHAAHVLVKKTPDDTCRGHVGGRDVRGQHVWPQGAPCWIRLGSHYPRKRVPLRGTS